MLPFQCTREDVGSAGFSCSEEAPCPVYLELSAATAAGNKYFVAGNIHSDAVTLYSVLLGSEDAGHSWREIHARIRAAGLDHLQFIDARPDGWPGSSFSRCPRTRSFCSPPMAGRAGASPRSSARAPTTISAPCRQCTFHRRSTAALIVDRSSGGDPGPFALYESPDGGASWTVKEQSPKPLRLKGAPAPDADWRVRVDGASKVVSHGAPARRAVVGAGVFCREYRLLPVERAVAPAVRIRKLLSRARSKRFLQSGASLTTDRSFAVTAPNSTGSRVAPAFAGRPGSSCPILYSIRQRNVSFDAPGTPASRSFLTLATRGPRIASRITEVREQLWS